MASNPSAEIRVELLRAMRDEDADRFELALRSAFVADLPADLADVFTNALLMTWHTCHEDLVSGLQQLKSPQSVEALAVAATVQHPYLDYDEHHGLGRKCTWALADIGSPLARAKLEELAAGPNSTIAGYARRRLDLWNEELDRKGS